MKVTKFLVGIMLTSSLLVGCDGSKNNPDPVEETTSKYVLMSVSDRTQPNGGGYISAYESLPSGSISNVVGGKTLSGPRGMAGWRVVNNAIFKMYRSADAVQGIEKINVAKDGTVNAGGFITSKNPTEAAKYYGTGNFVIENANNGFYWDAAEPLKIQKFDPSTMRNSGSIDLAATVNQQGSGVEDIKFRTIGQKFLAIKGGKLYANITYAKSNTTQAGFFDDYFPDVYIAVINIATGAYEKTIRIADTGGIAYINDNHMYDFDSNGDLYIVCQGRSPIGGKSKIVRIKSSESDIDTSWELNFSDFRAADNGKFVNVFAKDGRLIVLLNTVALTGGPTGNINSQDIWKFYSVNISGKQFNEITGIPTGTNPGAALAVTEIDNKILLRGSTANSNANGYYEYNPSTNSVATLFQVTEGGAVSGFAKIEIK